MRHIGCFALVGAVVVLALAQCTTGTSCLADYCSAEYAYEEHSGSCNFWRGCDNYKDTGYRWCADIWGSSPKDQFRSTKWDKTRLKKISGDSNTRCKNRADIGDNGECSYDSLAWAHNLYKC